MANPKKYFIEQIKNRVKFGPVDTAYMHVLERWSPDGVDKGAYSVMLLIPKAAAQVIEALQKGIDAAIADGVAKKWQGKKPKNLDLPLKDGEEKEDTSFADYMLLNAKAKEHRPGLGKIVNGAAVRDDFPESDEWYSGNKVIASISFFPYKVTGKTGVGCGLDSLLQVEKGERRAGSPSFDKDFGSMDLSSYGFGGDAEDDDL